MKRLIISAIVISFILTLAACGSNNGSTDAFGGITATAVWPGGSASGKSGTVLRKAPPEVAWVRMIVSKGTTTLQVDFDAVLGSGSISGVPAGTGWTLTFVGLNASKAVAYYEGFRTGITVVANTTTNAGSVAMGVMPGMVGQPITGFLTGAAHFPTPNDDTARGLAIQPDGKIVVTGASTTNFGLSSLFVTARYLPDGRPDSTANGSAAPFGPGGVGFVTTQTGSSSYAFSIALQADGRIVVAGTSESAATGHNNVTSVVRYLPDGMLDSSYGANGVVNVALGTAGQPNYGNAIGILPSGNTAAGGFVTVSGLDDDFSLGIFNTSGTLVAKATTSIASCTPGPWCLDRAYALAVQANGKIILAGGSLTDSTHATFAFARYNTDLSLDTTFNGTGKRLIPGPANQCEANAVAVQPDGKIVAAGYCLGAGLAVLRLNPDGSNDTSFNSGNIQITTTGAACETIALSIRIQPDGKIVVAGDTTAGAACATMKDGLIARYLSNGSLDSSFIPTGTQPGVVTWSINNGLTSASAVGLLQDGTIVTAGRGQFNPPEFDFNLARYWNNMTTNRKAYVVSTSSAIVAVMDLDTNRVYNIIDLGIGLNSPPTVIAVNPLANRAYVAVNDNDTGNTVLVLDTISERVIGSITVGAGPAALAIDPASNRLYVSNVTANTISVIDTTDNSLVGTIAGLSGRGIAVNPRTNRLYVVTGSSTVGVVDTLTNAVLTNIAIITTDPRGVAVNTLTNKIYVANYAAGTGIAVSVIDGATNQVSYLMVNVNGSTGPISLAVNEASNKIYVAMYGSAGAGTTVSVIDAANNNAVSQVTGFPAGPRNIAIDNKTNVVYVVSSAISTSVTAIDTMNGNALHPTTWDYAFYTWNVPDGIAIAP